MIIYVKIMCELIVLLVDNTRIDMNNILTKSINLFINNINRDDVYVSVAIFNTSIRWLREKQLSCEIVPIKNNELVSNSHACALYDSIADTIESVNFVSDNINMVIQTDTEDNCSIYNNSDSIKKIIRDRINNGWKFKVLCADRESTKIGGIPYSCIVPYMGDSMGTQRVFRTMARLVNSDRNCLTSDELNENLSNSPPNTIFTGVRSDNFA